MASSPPAAAVIGALSLGWTAGTVVGNWIDRTFKPGAGAAGNWWYEHVLQ